MQARTTARWALATSALVLTGCTAASAGGNVVLDASFDFETTGTTGTVVVSEGADVLGCSAGEIEAVTVSELQTVTVLCTDGDRSGTFDISLAFGAAAEGADRSGEWTVTQGSDGFAGLTGEGSFTLVFTADGDGGEGTFTGSVAYDG